jgi:hypothetical protein
MAYNNNGTVIPFQTSYGVLSKYGNRYGSQPFGGATTSLNNNNANGANGAGGTGATTLDGENSTPNSVSALAGGDATTLDSAAPGGTGGADFSQLRTYNAVQPDFGWLNNYGENQWAPPPLVSEGLGSDSDTPPTPTSGFISSEQDGGDDGTPEVAWYNSQTDAEANQGLDDAVSTADSAAAISQSQFGVNETFGDGTVDSVDTSITGPTADMGLGDINTDNDTPTGNANQGNDPTGNTSGGASTSENTDGASTDMGYSDYGSAGTLIEPIGQLGRERDKINHIPQMQMRDIPNPMMQDPFGHLFRRA